MMGNLDSLSSEDEGASSAPREEEVEKPEKKRRKVKANRVTRTSMGTKREKIPIRRPEGTTLSKDPSSDNDVVELEYLPTPPSQNDPIAPETNNP